MLPDGLNDKIDEFRKAYLKKLEDVIAGLKYFLDNEKNNIDEIYSKVHQISGTCGMYGLRELSSISTELEFYLKKLKNDNGIMIESELHEIFLKYIKDVETILKRG